MKHLSNVTLVMIDGTCPELARLSLLDSLDQISCDEVLVCSPVDLAVNGARWIETPRWSDRLGPSAFIWYELPGLVRTSHMLLTSWDAWVIDAAMWSDEFLTYDYVGAPWCYDDDLNVGHGLLRSTRLMQYLADHRDEFPIKHPEDDVLSRRYRPRLERAGFRWPSEQVASRFMFELSRPARESRHFMFHDSFNFPLVLNNARLAERVRLMKENAYLQGTNKLADIEAGRRPVILPRLATPPSACEPGYDAAEMMLRAGRREEASALLWEVVRHNPRHADAWMLRAMLEEQAGRPQNAILHHAMALQAAPGRYDLWCNRGIAAMSARMYREAEESFRRSLALQESFEGHYNFGNLLSALMRLPEAAEHYRAAIKLNDHNQQVHANLGVALIGQGLWREGFDAFRRRFNAPGFPPRPRFTFPQWHGEPLAGKTILLYVEQGFGDEILSLRFAAHVKATGARVILAVRPPMFRLARTFQGADAVILMYDEPTWPPDFMCALLDVPGFLGLEPKDIDGGQYLSADDRGFRLAFPPGLNVGICWSSGKRELQPNVAETARIKSLSFEQLTAPFEGIEGINLFSLQQTHADDAAMRRRGVRDPMPGVTDFADTAFILDHLDLVVTVDTAVAHLTGAMGKPVWNLVRFDAAWPWMAERGATCWYDSMAIYRQTRPLDWEPPLKQMRTDLRALAERRAAA